MRFQRSAELHNWEVEMAKVIWEAVPQFHCTQVYGFSQNLLS